MTQPIKRSRFQIQLNGIYSILETNLRFESATGILGVKINFEENLGMDKYRIIPMINARFNVKGRHNIFAMYYGLPRDAYYVTKQDIEFGDRIIPLCWRQHPAPIICCTPAPLSLSWFPVNPPADEWNIIGHIAYKETADLAVQIKKNYLRGRILTVAVICPSPKIHNQMCCMSMTCRQT